MFWIGSTFWTFLHSTFSLVDAILEGNQNALRVMDSKSLFISFSTEIWSIVNSLGNGKI